MENRQIDKKTTKQVRIDKGLHQLLKVMASEQGMTIKTLLEGYLAELLAVENVQIKDYKKRKARNDKIMKLKS